MGNGGVVKNAPILALLVALMLAPGTASAGEDIYQGKNGNSPLALSRASAPAVNPFVGVIIDPSPSGCCYTFPILVVQQCPAVHAGQPGSQVTHVWRDPRFGLLGGQPYLYHE
jgi:hypothetical protein